ncbi:MAG: 2-C-methyl-D-erythritol 4-phosphate cytidylyltransferase [Bacteroidia bacterium]|nr:2-C-methyl-D-erythritol 4-phosphate cytidylyltransferase [Bacteroidia bacterium]
MTLKRFAIIVAGGKGLRMGANLPKQFIELAGKPVLMHTLLSFAEIQDLQLVLVLPKDHFSYWEKLCINHNFTTEHQIVEGGNTRFQSVKNGLLAIKGKCSLVAIHDGVRPLVSKDVILNSFTNAHEKGNAITVVPLKDSLRKQELLSNHSVNRANYYLVQTPQTFQYQLINEAYERASNDDNFTDDASVLEAYGSSINMVEGDYKNLKITTPEDLIIAEALLNSYRIPLAIK